MKIHLLEKRKLRGEMARYAVLATNGVLIDTSKKIVLFGDGLDDCYSAKISLERYNKAITIFAFVDKDSRKWGRTLSGTKVVSPQEIKASPDEYYVIITADFGSWQQGGGGGDLEVELKNGFLTMVFM